MVAAAGKGLLEEAIHMTARRGLVQPHDHVVVVQMLHDDMSIKIITLDELGQGIADIRPKSLMDLIAVSMPTFPRDQSIF